MPTHRIDWLARQMYSKQGPIGRTQIFAGFSAALASLTGHAPSEPELIRQTEVPGAEYIGYSAAHETYRIRGGEAALICTIDPILASMGVSGEDHAWSAEGLGAGVVLRGSAKSSARQPSYAQIVVEGLDPGAVEPIFAGFAAAFPSIMSEAELAAELG